MPLTQENLLAKPLPHQRRILLDIALVVIERAVLPALQLIRILHHLRIQPIQDLGRNQVFDDDEAIALDSADGDFEVVLGELAIFDLGGGGLDREGG